VVIPQGFDSGGTKLQRARQVITKLTEQEHVQEYAKKLDELIQEIIAQKKDFFERYDERSRPLCRALRADGFEVREGRIVSVDNLEQELAQEASILYERLQSLHMADIQSNLEQAHENFIGGNEEACNAMLRTALEGTLQHIAAHLAGGIEKIPHQRRHLSPVDIRDYLSVSEFLSQDERKFVDALYGFASPNGSHPGLSNESESRLRRLMIIGWIQYCIEKLIAKLGE
jgi:hypothetical protein